MQEQTVMTPPKTRKTALVLVLILMTAIMAALAGLYFRSVHQQQMLMGQMQIMQLRLMQDRELMSQQSRQLDLLNSKVARIEQVTIHDDRKWVLAEAEYLVRLADFSLTFQSNIEVSVKLLTLADQRIKSLADPSLVSIRQAIANDIAALNAIPEVDITGLITQLNALSLEVTQLPVIPSTEINTQPAAESSPKAPGHQVLWQRLWNNMAQSLKNVVIIRRQTAIMPLLSPQQQAYLIENVRLQIAQAQWAVLHQQPAVYQQSLAQSLQWLKDYFVQSSNSTQSVISALENLQRINVKPAVPDVSGILKLLPTTKANA